MIEITVERDAKGEISAFTVTGHAGFAPHGSDIVCAAVSVLTQTAVIAVNRLAAMEPAVQMSSGLITFRLPEGRAGPAKEKADVILAAMLIGLKEVAASYPNRVKVKD